MDVRILLLLAGLALALVAIAVAAFRVTGDLAGQDLGSAPLALAVAGGGDGGPDGRIHLARPTRPLRPSAPTVGGPIAGRPGGG